MLIYVSGPYSAASEGERVANVRRGMEAARALLHKGHFVILPHLSHFFDIWHEEQHGVSLGYETYLAWDLELVARCDGLLRLAPSPGADRELKLAQEMGMPVWLSIDDVPRVG